MWRLRGGEDGALAGRDETLEFRILGPFEVWERGQPLEVGAGKQRALLALLLLRAGQVVSTDRLIDALWDEHAPASALNSVHIYVSQLRKVLDGRLETRGQGYLLALEPEQLDLGRFERLLAEGRELLAEGEAERAAGALRAGLAGAELHVRRALLRLGRETRQTRLGRHRACIRARPRPPAL